MIYKLRTFNPTKIYYVFSEDKITEGQYTINVKKLDESKRETVIEMIEKLFPESHSFSKRYILDFLKI